MGRTVLHMSMSLDGFVTGPDDDAAHGLGVGGERLHAWLAPGRDGDPRTMRPTGPSGEVFDEMLGTGAVLVGRRTFEFAGGWSGDHHDGVPIVVLAPRTEIKKNGRRVDARRLVPGDRGRVSAIRGSAARVEATGR